jgi:hypothetical protein
LQKKLLTAVVSSPSSLLGAARATRFGLQCLYLPSGPAHSTIFILNYFYFELKILFELHTMASTTTNDDDSNNMVEQAISSRRRCGRA